MGENEREKINQKLNQKKKNNKKIVLFDSDYHKNCLFILTRYFSKNLKVLFCFKINLLYLNQFYYKN